jgi:hypothetical protein
MGGVGFSVRNRTAVQLRLCHVEKVVRLPRRCFNESRRRKWDTATG